MKLINITFLTCAVGSLSAAAFAQDQAGNPTQDSGLYGAIGATTYDFENYGADAKLGYNFNKYLGVEAQGTLGLTDHGSPLCDRPECATATEKNEYTVGAFAVARIPLSEQFDIFARAGVHNTKYNVKINNALRSDYDVKETGFAGGGGVQYKLDSKNAIRAEYTYLDYNEEGWAGTATVAYVRKF